MNGSLLNFLALTEDFFFIPPTYVLTLIVAIIALVVTYWYTRRGAPRQWYKSRKVQKRNQQNDIFCSECGSKKESRFCEKCGKETNNRLIKVISETIRIPENISGSIERGETSISYLIAAYAVLVAILSASISKSEISPNLKRILRILGAYWPFLFMFFQ